MDLLQKHCIPCEGGTPLLTPEEIKTSQAAVPEWHVTDGKKISKEFKFSARGGSASGGKDSPFAAAMDFVNRVAKLAESEGHHPDIHIFYNLVRLELTTHAIHGLSENDFIMAAKIDSLKTPNPA